MKKFLSMLMLVMLFAITAPPPAHSADLLPVQTELAAADVQTVDAIFSYEASNEVQTFVQQEDDVGINLPELPGDGATTHDWIWWGLAAALFVLEIVLRLAPTARSYSIITLIYNLLSLLFTDKATNDGKFKVQRE
jgi:hypothetical protein